MPASRDLRPWALVRPVAITGGVLLAISAVLATVSSLMPAHTSAAFAAKAVSNVFWADNDINVWAWYSAVVDALLALAFAASLVVRRAAGRPIAADVAFTVVATYISLDEAAALHERLGSLGGRLGAGWTYAWVVIGLPLAIVVGVVLLRVARRVERVTRRRLVVGAIVFLSGSVGFETLGGFMHRTLRIAWSSLPYIAEVTVEEGLETAGVLIALWAALHRVRIGVGADGLRLGVPEAEPPAAGSAEPVLDTAVAVEPRSVPEQSAVPLAR